MTRRKLTILGATGSIGESTMDVIAQLAGARPSTSGR